MIVSATATQKSFSFQRWAAIHYDNDTLKEIQACHHVWASGVRTGFISIPSGKQAAMFVIHFKKGMAYPFFPVPLNEMSDRVVDADLLWGRDFAHLREHLLAISEIDLKFVAAERFLLKHFQNKFSLNPAVEYAVAQIVRAPDQINLGRVSWVFATRKSISSRCSQQVDHSQGLSENYSLSKSRREIEQRRTLTVDISQDCGFTISPLHSRLQVLLGFTPKNTNAAKAIFSLRAGWLAADSTRSAAHAVSRQVIY